MKNLKLSFSTLAAFVITILVSGSALSSQLQTSMEEPSIQRYIPATADSPVNIEVVQSATAVELMLTIPGIEGENGSEGVEWRIRNEGLINQPGMPELPAVGRWVRVPDYGRLELYYNVRSQKRVASQPPVVDVEPDGLFPPEPVVMGRPMVMRGVRMVHLTYYPVRWDAEEGEYLVSESIDVEIRNLGGQGVNEVIDRERIPSRSFDRMIDALLVNPPRRDNPLEYPPGGYLLVANEDPPEGVTEFSDWKYAFGHPVEILTFDPEATDEIQLKVMIQDVYREFNFEYLVLFGNENADPPLQIPFQTGGDGYYDVFFAQLEGDDPLADVAVGSFNCLDEGNLICAVRRAISYQYEPYTDDLDWYTKAGVGVGACSVQQDLSPSYTGKWVAEVLSRNGFDDITTSFFSDNGPDDPTPMVCDLYNSRTNFILIRAHQNDFDADEIEATDVYPFHFLVSSSTLSGAFNRAFRMGTPDDMRGPSAGFGHNGSPRTNVANALAGGFIESVFLHKIGCYGWARNYTIANLARVMPADDDDYIYGYYSSFRYYGDPGQWCWVGVPQSIRAEFSQSLNPDATEFTVHVVTDEDEPQPVPNATVCLTNGEDFQAVSRTDEIGFSVFTFERGNLEEGDLNITITGENLYPVNTSIQVEQADFYIALADVEYDDEAGGNGDGVLNPDEEGELFFELQNTSDRQTPAATVLLESLSAWATVELVACQLVPIDPGVTIRIEEPFPISILDGCPDSEILELRLSITPDGEFPIIMAGVQLEVMAPNITIGFALPEDNLEPGSVTELTVSLINNGRRDAGELTARLVSLTPFVQVIANNCHYPEIPIDEEVEPQGDNLMVSAAEVTIPGSIAEFALIVDGDPGVRDTLYFSLPVGEAGEGDPLGPDSYGYIALDDGDDVVEWADVPEYDWLDISPWGGGDVMGELLIEPPINGEDDVSVLVDLPIAFRYYGEDFEQITVCSNGWIAMGDQTELVNQQNWVMPGFDGAYGMIAVFWDRLNMQTRSDGVFTYYDQINHRFYIEWHTGVMDDNDWAPNVFELVLYDCNRYPTWTGDSPILMQYNVVNNVQGEWEANYHCTVGISSPDGKDGLLYTYWNDYPPQCAPLQNERAILWTTNIYFFETGSVHGRVTRYIDSTAVADMMVCAAHGLGAMTDENGEYRFDNLWLGPYQFYCGSGPYGTVIQEVEVVADEDIELDFVLPHGWLIADPDTIIVDFFWPGFPIEMLLNLSNEGNLDLDIEDITCNTDYFDVEPSDLILEPEEDCCVYLIVEFGDLEPGHYEYELSFISNNPISPFIVPIIVDVLDAVWGTEPKLPDEFVLFAPYPNPFNSSTTVRFGVPVNAEVELSLFDLSGRNVATLESGRYPAGWHRSVIDASGLSTGLYFIRMEAGDFRSTRRVLLVR